MAESFEPSEDGLTWTLNLRSGLTFTDGTPYGAEAIVYNWQRHLEPSTLSPAANLARELTWRAVDPRTVEIKLATPNYQLPWAMTGLLGMIGSPTAMLQKGPDFANAPVGAGPFVLDRWVRGTELVVKRNPGYWDQPRPYVEEFVYKLIPPDELRAQAFQSGEIDVILTYIQPIIEDLKEQGAAETLIGNISGSGWRITTRPQPVRS